MAKILHIRALLLAITFLVVGSSFAQKVNEKSKLNIGQSKKKVSFTTNNILVKTNFSKELSINTKPSFTQFYRDLLLTNHISTANSEAVTNKINSADKITLSNIFPNPADDFASVDYKMESNYNTANLTFFNLLGKVVADLEIPKGNDRLRIDTSSWESGIYMYQLIVDGKKISTKKLLVRHN